MHILRGFSMRRPQENLMVLKPVWATLINVAQAGKPQHLVLSGKFKSYATSVLEVMQEGHE